MITVADNVTRVEGDPKQLITEMTILLSAVKATLIKEYAMKDDDVNNILIKACDIAFMNNYQRKKLLDKLENNNYD